METKTFGKIRYIGLTTEVLEYGLNRMSPANPITGGFLGPMKGRC